MATKKRDEISSRAMMGWVMWHTRQGEPGLAELWQRKYLGWPLNMGSVKKGVV